MPVQYQPIPEFQAPNVNILGAYAQGQALQQNRLQQERLAQQMDLAERAAGYTALKDARAAQKEEQESLNREFDLAAKYRDQFQAEVSRINPRAPDFQAKYDALIQRYTPLAPTLMAGVPKTHTPETWQAFISSHDDLIKQLSPSERETVVDGVRGKALYRTDPFTQQRVMVADSFVPAQEKWTPVRGAKQDIEYYTNDAGTKILTPEQYKAMAQGNAAAAAAPAGRGQAGAFTPGNMTEELVAGREGFKATPYFDVNADRIGYGSSTVTREDGTVEKVRKGMAPITEEDARRDLRRRLETEFAPKAAAKVGEDVWARLPENVRAPLTSIAYNYGTIPSRIVPAVQSGNPETIARAIESLAGDNKGVNAGRRMQEANIARGTAFPGSRAVPAFAATGTPEFMGGPQIQPPINMMAAPVAPPVNAMVAPPIATPAPAPAPAPIAQPTPQPQAMPITAPDDVKQRQEKFIADAPLGQSAKYRGKVDLENMLTNFANELEYLKEQDAIPSTSNTAARNAEISSGASWLGQAYGRFTGTPAQSTRDAIDSIRQNLVSVLARATGKTAQELNSNFDVKNAIKALGDPKATIESTRATLNNINKTFGTNVDIGGSAAKSESRRQIEASKAAPAIPEAAGIDPAAIKMLRDNPDTAAAFDAHFGTPGLAAKILGR